MIARTWRGWTAAADADRYVDYLHATGVREYRRVAVFYPEDDAFLVERERHADHFEVLLAPDALQGP